MTSQPRSGASGRICSHQDCNVRTAGNDHYLCQQHFLAARQGTITKCSRCSNFKPARYPLCGSCFVGNSNPAGTQQTGPAVKETNGKYALEDAPNWKSGDATATEFYVYILRLRGGQFYIGQTRELLERLSEHLDGKEQSTKGRNPRLVWFTELPSRKSATELEAELKEIRDRNEREIRRMIVRFKGAAEKLDFTEG